MFYWLNNLRQDCSCLQRRAIVRKIGILVNQDGHDFATASAGDGGRAGNERTGGNARRDFGRSSSRRGDVVDRLQEWVEVRVAGDSGHVVEKHARTQLLLKTEAALNQRTDPFVPRLDVPLIRLR